MAHRCCIQGIVAILLFYGADSHQTCRQYRNYNAFDYLLNFRPYREYGIYYFLYSTLAQTIVITYHYYQ